MNLIRQSFVSVRPSTLSLWNTRVVSVIIIVSLAALAFLIRVPELGKWGLAVDEYYLSRSVSFILEKGVPEFPDGGYYSRGIALQYLTAASVFLFEDWEFAVRFFPLVFGVLSIPLFYLVCRLHLTTFPAVLCAAMLLLSSWHIEFSRFARMYTVFQFAFLGFLYLFYSGYWQGKRGHQIGSWIVAFLSIFLYEGSIFMPVLLLLALFSEDSLLSRKSKELIAVVGVLLAVNYIAHGISYRYWGVDNPFPVEMPVTDGNSSVVIPNLNLFLSVWRSFFPFVVYLLLVMGSLFLIYRSLKMCRGFWGLAMIFLCAILPLFHQYGLLIFLSILFLLGRRDSLDFVFLNPRLWATYFSISLMFWLVLGYLSINDGLQTGSSVLYFKEAFNALFRYPLVYDSIFFSFRKTVPVWGVFALLAIVISIFHQVFLEKHKEHGFPLMILLSCIFLVGIFRTPYMSTRYSFFFFPIVLLVGYILMVATLNWIRIRFGTWAGARFAHVLVLIPLLVFILTEDFSFGHVLSVSSPEANFRMGELKKYENHWYGRSDFEGPARYVNAAFQIGDTIVIDYVPSSFYLSQPFVNYIPIDNQRFKGVSRKRGQKEAWTGKPLIYKLDDLFNLVPTRHESSLWLIVAQNGAGGAFKDIDALALWAASNKVKAAPVFEGIDGTIGVWRLNRYP